jgi:hypothetical protein
MALTVHWLDTDARERYFHGSSLPVQINMTEGPLDSGPFAEVYQRLVVAPRRAHGVGFDPEPPEDLIREPPCVCCGKDVDSVGLFYP